MIYVNGKAQSVSYASEGSFSSPTNYDSVKIGKGFNGLIDEVQIYKEALTLSQIEQLYAQGVISRAMAYR